MRIGERFWSAWATLVALMAVGIDAGAFAQEAPSHGVVPLHEMHGQVKETIWGDPDREGSPFVIRIHADAGYVVLPHVHPVDENIVVLQGQWALGMGKQFDETTLQPLAPGSFGFAGKGMAHFAVSVTDSTIQVHGTGAFWAKLVDPAYEINEKGRFLLAYLLQPGTPTASVPAGCFAHQVGEHVRTDHEEGVVRSARCSPANHLTQYWIEAGDKHRFWAREAAVHSVEK